MKIIRHKWQLTSFKTYTCVKCSCIKQHIVKRLCFYFRSGIQLASLPECKSIFNNDKI